VYADESSGLSAGARTRFSRHACVCQPRADGVYVSGALSPVTSKLSIATLVTEAMILHLELPMTAGRVQAQVPRAAQLKRASFEFGAATPENLKAAYTCIFRAILSVESRCT